MRLALLLQTREMASATKLLFPADAAGYHLPRTSDMAVTTIVAAAALLALCAVGFLVAYRAERRK